MLTENIEKEIDAYIQGKKSTEEIKQIFLQKGWTESSFGDLISQYNEKSLAGSDVKRKKTGKSVLIISIILISIITGALYYLDIFSLGLSSNDRMGRIFYKELPKNLKYFAKCDSSNILGKWEQVHSSIPAVEERMSITQINFDKNGETKLGYIERVGEKRREKTEDEKRMMEIVMNNIPSGHYTINDGVLYVPYDERTNEQIAIVCLIAGDDTDFLKISLEKDEMLHILFDKNDEIAFYESYKRFE